MDRDRDWDDPNVVEEWLKRQREDVERYLAAQEIAVLPHGLQADWFIPPILALWKASTLLDDPRSVWVISGDVPTDYIPGSWAATGRDALRRIAERWRRSADLMSRGIAELNTSIGRPENWPELAPMLASRAKTLLKWAGDGTLWTD